jgi:glutathione S-transferase
VPKFLGHLERLLARDGHLVSDGISYADLGAFQIPAGLRYASPTAMGGLDPQLPLLVPLHDRVAARPRVAAYLASARRTPFNEHGIFRHYPELDAGA